MKYLFSHFAFLLSILSIGLVSCQEGSYNIAPIANEKTAATYLTDIGFQGSVLLRKGSTDILRQGFGMADMAAGLPNTPETTFRIGSMSKAFTALAIVQLKREGLIEGFDQPVSDFVEGFPSGDQVTLRHLLTHASGIPDHTGTFEEVIRSQNYHLEPDEMFEMFAEALAEEGLLFAPGSRRQYSNTNYLMLALLVEELSGMPYHTYLQQTALAPLGMANTYHSSDDPTGAGEAKGYHNGQKVAAYPMEVAFGAGDWSSNLADMEKWADAWMGNLLTEAEQAEVFPSPQQAETTEFGMGWFIIHTHGQLIYFHGGDIDGFTSLIALFPETNGVLIALSNAEGQRAQLDQLLELLPQNELKP